MKNTTKKVSEVKPKSLTNRQKNAIIASSKVKATIGFGTHIPAFFLVGMKKHGKQMAF